ncbi:MAG: hypothetical protein K0R80_2411 [Clostridia bacterium]|jgi:hypothetical protein|nr:hypothetical protein [Clostridia bacterium]
MENSNKEQKSPTDAVKAAAIPEVLVIEAVVDITKESIRCFTDYMKCREHEVTERHRITAQLKAINEAINAKKEMYIATLEKNHDKIKEAYAMGNMVVKSALETGNTEMVRETYKFIISMSTIVGDQADGIMSKFINSNDTTILLK